MYFYELLLFPQKKIHICFEGYETAGAWLEHNIPIQCWKDIDIHCQQNIIKVGIPSAWDVGPGARMPDLGL